MNSELEILKKIWENNGKTHFKNIHTNTLAKQGSRRRRGSYIKLISNQSGLGIDYARYICNCLFKKGEIQPIKGKRDWYRITTQGKKELKLYGVIKPGIPRKIRTCSLRSQNLDSLRYKPHNLKLSKVEKVVYYLPKRLKTKPKKIEIKKAKEVRPKELKSNLVVAEEKKLNWGKKIEKAVAFLIKRSNQYAKK
ncbi:hypothetical protein KJ841_01480 [Patescibacteria group bacterium]|nr:hypothetical protein [Patescibacteria group bacterium]